MPLRLIAWRGPKGFSKWHIPSPTGTLYCGAKIPEGTATDHRDSWHFDVCTICLGGACFALIQRVDRLEAELKRLNDLAELTPHGE